MSCSAPVRCQTVALTFDDGPDAEWTPKILDVLEREHVPATFFVIGENALQHPQLLRRIVAGGSELGNHSYTHPNMATTGARTIKLELNATKRLIQAYTGRSTTLFRAPYFGDAEPTTADEIDPALVAQNLGYTVVGLHVDPNDWQRPGTDQIVQQTIDQVHGATADNSAMSSCCTMAAAIASRRSRHCRASSIRCAHRAIASWPPRSWSGSAATRRCRWSTARTRWRCAPTSRSSWCWPSCPHRSPGCSIWRSRWASHARW
jgi:hypothetical protein